MHAMSSVLRTILFSAVSLSILQNAQCFSQNNAPLSRLQDAMCASRRVRTRPAHAAPRASLEPGDTVVVVGAQSRVGSLVSGMLVKQNRFDLRLVGSSMAWAQEGVETKGGRLFIGNVAQDIDHRELFLCQVGAGGQNAVVGLRDVLRGARAVLICNDATAFPSLSWVVQGRSPYLQDVVQTRNVVSALDVSSTQVLTYLSSIGAQRSLPKLPRLDQNLLLSITNLFGAIGQLSMSIAQLVSILSCPQQMFKFDHRSTSPQGGGVQREGGGVHKALHSWRGWRCTQSSPLALSASCRTDVRTHKMSASHRTRFVCPSASGSVFVARCSRLP